MKKDTQKENSRAPGSPAKPPQADWPYEDIVNLPHHVSERHPRMEMSRRAAQFAPFAALKGYDH